MSFGGNFGGFGQTSNNAQPSAFGGFGSSTNNATGFGASTTGSTFGSSNANTGTGLFGSGAGTGGFGANPGSTFGQTNNAFGSTPAFGATATTSSGGGLFGSTTTATAGNTGFGGFGATNTASTSTPFGGGGTSIFGGAKPATTFGATTAPAAGGSLFGGGGTGGAFGSTTGSAFGATANPGLGVTGDPPGTNQVQFTPTIEKEPNNPSQSNSYQNILFQDPYKKWSSEELRLQDYNQGRRHGNATGAGAFGQSTGFGAANTGGGFGSTTTPATGFGATNTSGSLFGGSQPAAGGFGSSAGNNLFGAAKPAQTGIFGSTPAQPTTTGGSLFGGGATTSGFGGAANTGTTGFGASGNTSTGTGMFGQSANQAKPAPFGGFGSTGTTTGGFGATNTAAAGTTPFGNAASTGPGLFGQNNQTTTTRGGIFGSTPQQTNATGGFGSSGTQTAGTGIFGQAKPTTGLFGSTNNATTGTTGFGSSAPASNPFGAAANSTTQAAGTSTGLFAPKPAAAGGGIFGNATQQSGNSGGGIFGGLNASNTTQQPAQGNSLFGGLNQNNQNKSVFGAAPSTTGGGIFGGQSNQQATGGSIFGGSTQQQQGGLGGSLLGSMQNQQQAQSLSTNINDISAYGSASLFSNLASDETQNPGPLATPLNGNKNKLKSRSILPMYKLSPANATRFVTPQKRGFGFSYSTYGTPSSASSVSSTPGGMGQSLLMANASRSLNKSISTSSLRRSFNVEDSVLAPGAFSASTGPRVTSHKKLIINKELRSDLFTSPAKKDLNQDINGARKLTKRVSFDTSAGPQAIENGSQDAESQTPDGYNKEAQDLGYLRPSSRQTNGVNGSKSTSSPAVPEMEQVKGNELAIVHEEDRSPSDARVSQQAGDREPGAYWMYPSKEAIENMSRTQRQKVEGFQVGREHVGSIAFQVPVDLSDIDLDQLYENIVILEPRSATVYPVVAKKPPQGKGLNVPAIISLEQSWPRARDKRTRLQDQTGARFAKHVERLKRIPDTEFISYDQETGVWTFRVEHFTTYGLEDDDDEEETEGQGVPPVSSSSAKQPDSARSEHTVDTDTGSPEYDPDDTFDFMQSRKSVPGAFDGTPLYDDQDMVESDQLQRIPSESPEPEESTMHEEYEGRGEDESMGDAYEEDTRGDELAQVPSPMEGEEGEDQHYGGSVMGGNEQQLPAGILRARMRALKKSTAPTRIQVAGGDDWTQILQQSVRAPRRMDRSTLRALNESGAAWDVEERGSPLAKSRFGVADGAGFATSIDLMKSLFEQAKAPSQPEQTLSSTGFVKWPYQRRDKLDLEHDELELAYRSSPRLKWGPRETAVITTNDQALHQSRITIQPAVKITGLQDVPGLQSMLEHTDVQFVNGVPAVVTKRPVSIKSLAGGDDKAWQLASVLFDNNASDLSAFWQTLVRDSTAQSINEAQASEEKAIACLAGNWTIEACQNLLAGKNFRLATLLTAVGVNPSAKKDVRQQLKDWQETNVLSEMSEPIRAIYEILAGNTSVCDGVKGVPIENRLDSFVISQRFNLDWMQSFGLCLWHGGHATVQEAVRSFQNFIEQDLEAEPDSPLWMLLKLFAEGQVDYSYYRLDWQLTRALYSNGKVAFGALADEKLDEMTTSFASELLAKGQWVPAVFVLTHISSPSARTSAIREQLGRHAGLIDEKDSNSGGIFHTLTDKLKVPATWIWEAKALHARSVLRDSVAEFAYLLLAEDFAEANRTFLKRVAPIAIIRREYTSLYEYARLLYQIKDKLPDWQTGAAVYLFFPATRNWDSAQPPAWIDQLVEGLLALKAKTKADDILEVAAIADMAEELVVLGRKLYKQGWGKLYKMAGSLPLADDRKQILLREQIFEGLGVGAA